MTDETTAAQASTTPAEGASDTSKTAPADKAGAETRELEAEGLVEPKGETEPKPKGEGEQGDDEAGGDDKPKPLSGAQRAKLRQQRLLAQNVELERRLAEVTAAQRGDGKAAADQPPKEEDFKGDYLAFERAMTAHTVRQVVREEKARDEQSKRAERDLEARHESVAVYEERLEAIKDRIPDFKETLDGMKGVNVRDDVIGEIMSSDKGPLLAYHLAKNPDKLRELNSLSAKELAREIGRLEGSVRMPAGKQKTEAQTPPGKIAGGAAPVPSLTGLSPEQYRKRREAGVT